MTIQKKYRWMTIGGWLACAVLLPGLACTRTYSTFTDTSTAPTQASQTLVDYLRNNYSFSIFYAGLQRVGLDKQIDSNEKYTLAIPDNDAFARAGITQDSMMSMDTAALRQWLGFHIVQGAIAYDSVPQTIDNAYYSILGQKIFFSRPIPSSNGASGAQALHIDGVAVNNFDIKASNGFIQVLNTPLNAPVQGTLQDYINAHLDQYSLFKLCLQHFNFWDNLATDTANQLTVFAPVNSSFFNIPAYLQGEGVDTTINIDSATIVGWDTTVVPRALFEVYFIPSRIFTTDFADAPPNTGVNGTYAGYIFPDRSAAVGFGIYGQATISASLLTAYQNQLLVDAQGTVIPPGNFATVNGNNVLQPIDHVLLAP